MPSSRVHEAIAKELNKDYKLNELLLRIGTVSPDCWRNVEPESGVKDKYLTHFWDFRVKSGEANDYTEFYLKYYDKLSNPFYFGYLIHLMVDQYWKTNVDPKYRKIKDGVKGFLLKDGSFHSDEEYWGYYDTLKMQRSLAKMYDLDFLPTNKEDYPGFECKIDELNINGLFGNAGTINYMNTHSLPADEESLIYDMAIVKEDILKTVDFIKNELVRLASVKKDFDGKAKVAVDIDDTILCTDELKQIYWKKFLEEHPEIDANKKYVWGDPELALFWKLYRENMAFGRPKDGVAKALDELRSRGYVVDLLSARPLDKYASLKKRLVEHMEANQINYSHMNLGFHSKKEFLKEHNYDIIIDDDKTHILGAEEVGVCPILFGNDPEYTGYQTTDWNEIPFMVEKILAKRRGKKGI